jgi:GAF domain-containing protein
LRLALLVVAVVGLPLALLVLGDTIAAVAVAAVSLAAAWLLGRTSRARAVLESESQAKSARLESVTRLAQAVTTTPSLEELFARVAEAASRLVPESSVKLWIVEGDDVALRAEAGTDGAIGAPRTRFRIGEGLVGHAAATRASLIVEDILTDPRTLDREWFREHGCRSCAQIPLLVRDRCCGVLGLYTSARHHFVQEETELLTAFANQAAIAIENARLYETAAERLSRLEALRAIDRRISERLEPESVLAQISRAATELLAGISSSVYLVEGGELQPRAWHGMGDWIRDVSLPLDSGLTGAVLARREGMILNEYPLSPYAREPFRRINHRVIVQPLLAGDRVLGVIYVNRSSHQPPFDEDDLAVVGDFATQAAVALEHARLYAEVSRRAVRLRSLAETGRLLVATLDTSRILEIVTAQCLDGLDVSDVAIYLLDKDHGNLRLLTIAPATADPGHVDLLEPGEGVVGRAVEERRSVWTPDALHDPSIRYRPELRERIAARRRHALLAVPFAREETVGALLIGRPAGATFSPDEIEFASTLTSQVAVALENARLFSLEQRRRAQIEALAGIERELTAELHTERLLDLIIERAGGLLEAEGAIFLLDSDAMLVPRAWYGVGPWLRDIRIPIGVNVAGVCARDRRGLIVNEYEASPLGRPEFARRGIRRVMAQPLLARDRLLGVIALNRGHGSAPFRDGDLATFETFANQAAIAIENARLYRDAKRHGEHLAALDVVNRQVSSSLDFEEVLRNIAIATGRFFDAPYVSVWVADPEARKLRRSVVVGDRELSGRLPGELAFGEGGAGWTAEQRQPILWADLQEDRRIIGGAIAARRGLRYFTALPVTLGDRLLGVISMRRSTPPSTTPEAESLARSLTAQAAVALEHARLYAETARRLAETRSLLEVTTVLNSTLETRKLLEQVAMTIARVCGIERCTIDLIVDGRASPLTSQFADGHTEPELWRQFVSQPPYDPRSIPAYARALETRAPVVVDDASDATLIPPQWVDTCGVGGSLVVPLLRHDAVIGFMHLDVLRRRGRFEPWQVSLAAAIGAQLALAIENSRLFSDNQRRLEELALLHELSQAVTGQLDRAALVEVIYRQLARVLDAPTGGIFAYDERRQEFEALLRMRNGAIEVAETGRRYPVGVGLMTRLVERRQAIRTDDYVEACGREGVTPLDTDQPLPYWVGAPMIAGDEVVGAIALRGGARPFTEADARLLTNIAGLAALAFRSARLYEERTQAYSELVAAQDHLLRVDKLRALGEMASGVAHDFNNLLASIVGRTQMLLQAVEDPRLRQWLGVIERAARDGTQTVRRLQEFTRIRRDQAFVPVDLNEVAREALEVTQFRWRDEAMSRGIDLQVVTSFAGRASVSGDPAELREALINLILNAVDAMESGGVLTLATRVDGDAVVLTVADTGEGMSAEVQRRLFEPFFTTKGPKGTGLGLSVTFGIVSRHGGQIEVDSAPGKGTRLELRFPQARAEPAVLAGPPAAVVAGAGEPARCLVVDDEDEVRDMLGDVLALGGHTPVLVSSGSEAITRFRAEDFDIVLTDLGMSGVTGWQVARACKEAEPAVPVLLVTGWGVEVSPEDLAAHGVDAVLSKPLNVDQVLSAVAAYRRRR